MAQNQMARIPQSQLDILNRYLNERPVKLGKLSDELGVKIKVSSLEAGI